MVCDPHELSESVLGGEKGEAHAREIDGQLYSWEEMPGGRFPEHHGPRGKRGRATKSSKKHNVLGYILSAAHLPRHPAT